MVDTSDNPLGDPFVHKIHPKELDNFDCSPWVKEIFLPNHESEIQWHHRSEIWVLEEKEEEEEEDMDKEE